MRSHQARAKVLTTMSFSQGMVQRIVTRTLSSQERRYIEQTLARDNTTIPVILAGGTKGRSHIIFGTYPLKILNAANQFYNEMLDRHPDDFASRTLVQRRLRAMTDRLAELPDKNMTEAEEAEHVQKEYDELVKLASFLVQHDLRPLGAYEATSTLLGW